MNIATPTQPGALPPVRPMRPAMPAMPPPAAAPSIVPSIAPEPNPWDQMTIRPAPPPAAPPAGDEWDQMFQGMRPGASRIDRALGTQTGLNTVEGNGRIDIDIGRQAAGVPGVPPNPFRKTYMNRAQQMGAADEIGLDHPGGDTFNTRWGNG